MKRGGWFPVKLTAACFFVFGGFVAPLGCDSCNKKESAEPAEAGAPSREQLSDVRKACEHRAGWKNLILKKCTRCIALAAAPKCSCPADREPFSGVCVKQQRARLDEKSCEPVSNCVFKCKTTDCDCLDKCFEGQDKCRKLISAVDGCVAATCDEYCR
jgi:hypothetical protein